jgi:transcriptional antiterminator NusG
MAEEAAIQAPQEVPKSAIFAVKTTANQERSVANMIAMVTRKEQLDIRSVLVPEELKGYVLVESPMQEIVEQAITNIPHAKAVVRGASSITEVQHFLAPKPTVTGISEGDIVELTAGPFKGEKARVKRIDTTHEEITVELFEAMVPIPVTVRGDNVRILKREENEK